MIDKQSFEIFISHGLDGFYRFAYGYMGNREDAEDVVNDSVIKAIRALGTLEEESHLKTWFYTIMANTAKTALKNKARVIPIDVGSPEGENAFEVGRNGLADVMTGKDPLNVIEEMGFNDLVAILDEEIRPIVVMRFMEDRPLAEIARILDENLNTVKSKLYRALKQLRIEMVKGFDEGGTYDTYSR